MNSKRLHWWESALLLAFAVTLLLGSCASAARSALSEQVLRLHVVANSDSQQDQTIKLQVRDAVLECARPLLEGVESSPEAERILRSQLDVLQSAAQEALGSAGSSHSVTVTVEDQWFPTKQYDSFALPAGQYRALKVVIGAGAGRNWWCVVFPPLCVATVTEEVAAAAMQAGLTEEQVALITGRDGGYVLKFKVVEWWEELLNKLGLS